MSQGEELFGSAYKRGEIIFSQDDIGDTMYIIQSGAVEISQRQGDSKVVLALLEKGDFFGEMALVDTHPRTATAKAISRSRLLPLTRPSLMKRIQQDPGVVIHLLKTLCQRIQHTNQVIQTAIQGDESLRAILLNKTIEESPLSKPGGNSLAEEKDAPSPHMSSTSQNPDDPFLSDQQLLRHSVDYDIRRNECTVLGEGDAVFREGDPGDALFLIEEGEIVISHGNGNDAEVIAYLGPGDFFGETSIITDQPRTAHAFATRQTYLLPVKKDDFLRRIQAEPELALYILQGLIIRLRKMLSAMSDPGKSLTTIAKTLPPPIRKKSPVRTAILSLSTCGGCSAAFLQDQDELTRLLEKVDITYCPMLIDESEIHTVDVAIVDGLVRVKEDEEKLEEARHKSRYLIAWGTCASFGGIPAIANQYELEELIAESYGHAKDPLAYYLSGSQGVDRATYQDQTNELKLLRRARKLDEFVKVDYYLPGCPPQVPFLIQLVGELRGDGQPVKPRPIVCAECSRKNIKLPVDYFWISPRPEWDTEHCFTSRGSICLGFMTKGGCGAVCPQGGLPCWGCRGPAETVMKKLDEGNTIEEIMMNSLVNRHQHIEDQIRSVMRIYRKHANTSLKFNRYFSIDRSRIR
jgi:F420-non-reducing hydrogenase small subunit